MAKSEPTSLRNHFAKISAEILAKPVRPVDRDEEKRRAEETIAASVNALRRAIGARYAKCRLDTFQLSADPTTKNLQLGVLASLQAFVDDLPQRVADGTGLFLYGPAGTGKDHLLAAVMLEAAQRGFVVCWANGLDVFGRVRDNISEGGEESVIIGKLVAPTVLAISDPIPPIGEVKTFQRSILLQAIDRRYRSRKPTWITANFADRKEADERLGVQIVDRLTDDALSLGCNWPSYRQQRRWRP